VFEITPLHIKTRHKFSNLLFRKEVNRFADCDLQTYNYNLK